MQNSSKISSLAKISMAAGLLISLSGCPFICGEQNTETFTISTEAANFVPYTGNETIHFTNDSNTVISFTGSFNTYMEDVDGCYCGCCSQNFTGESRNYLFLGDTLDYRIGVSLLAMQDGLHCTINGTHSYSEDFVTEHIDCSGKKSFPDCIGDLIVNGILYHNVFKVRLNQFQNTIFIQYVYYSSSSGFVEFIMSDGETWNLQP